jgi:hypothetical protein
MARLPTPFETLQSLQQALDSYRTSSWLGAGPSGGGASPPINVFRKVRLGGKRCLGDRR